MAVFVRQNNLWRNITFSIPPIGVSGTWSDETNNRFYLDTSKTASVQASRKYTNNTGKLMLVRAVPGIDRVARNLTEAEVSGSFSIAYVNDSEVARRRDNGTFEADQGRFETQFFVPNGGEYYVKCFKADSSAWEGDDSNGDPYVETIEWAEFTFD
tara:strand:- start:9 stop:476 length:468 start_codon:yes stop_codon:yes gene_type:complete